jgi:hypothetical protein
MVGVGDCVCVVRLKGVLWGSVLEGSSFKDGFGLVWFGTTAVGKFYS